MAAYHHYLSREQDAGFGEKGGEFGEERRGFNRREGRTEPPIFWHTVPGETVEAESGLWGGAKAWAQQQQGIHLTDLGEGLGLGGCVSCSSLDRWSELRVMH